MSKQKAPSRPVYVRVLRLRHLRPNAWQRAALVEGVIFVAVVLVLAEKATVWAIPVLPVVVAAVVKFHDVLTGALAQLTSAPQVTQASGVRQSVAQSVPQSVPQPTPPEQPVVGAPLAAPTRRLRPPPVGLVPPAVAQPAPPPGRSTGPDVRDSSPGRDIDQLCRAAVRQAEDQLFRNGVMDAFGLALSEAGTVRVLGGEPTGEQAPAEVEQALRQRLRALAMLGKICAAAVGTQTDEHLDPGADGALHLSVEHRDARPVTLVLPYRLHGARGTVEFGQPRAREGGEPGPVFAADGDDADLVDAPGG